MGKIWFFFLYLVLNMNKVCLIVLVLLFLCGDVELNFGFKIDFSI